MSQIFELKINKKLCSKLPKIQTFCITNQAGLSTKEVSFNLKNKCQ